jgi:MoxR-like ATPase
MPIADNVLEYAVKLAGNTRPNRNGSPASINNYISWGAGPRASQALILAGKARAILDGRLAVSTDDVKALAGPTLRHRLIVNYKAEAEGMNAQQVVERIVEVVRPT